jgi:uncharacterized protein YdeI (YjbR/CyaY-like superfamily)
MNPKVDFYFSKAEKWQEEIEQLRLIVLGCGLTEELKWGCPCYTLQKKNIVLIHVFKEYCALLFMKGVLLKDEHQILIQQTEHVQVARQIRFTNIREIIKLKSVLKAYINEAVEVEKAGIKVEVKTKPKLLYPAELQHELDTNAAFKKAFEMLTPGRQRAYNLFFSAAKQSKTREERVRKCLPQILKGKGLND